MLDGRMRRLIDPVLGRVTGHVAARGITADQLTIAGCGLGLTGAIAIAAGLPLAGLVLFLAGRVLDGLDGAVARISGVTNRGAYLDIVLDFAVYAAIPLAFALLDPARNALAAAALLAAFLVNGAAFLGFALMAERLGFETRAQGEKSLYYLSGLAGGTETIAAFTAFCLWPAWFPALAFGFAALCALSACARIALAWRLLSGRAA
jgi:phosphatidylglycerophosphate synthase